MRVTEKLALIDKIGRILQTRFSYTEIDAFLKEFDILPPKEVTSNSKWIYSKSALNGAAIETILKIAEELDLAPHSTIRSATQPPRNWLNTNDFRLFISHISKDKSKAARLRECLNRFGINSFVAHEDIHPTLEWQIEIERALYTMDAFLALHTDGFSKSFWTQQEIGFAVGRGVKIISLKFDEDPTGFISKKQALPRRQKKAEEIAREINEILLEDAQTNGRLKAANKVLPADLDDDIPF